MTHKELSIELLSIAPLEIELTKENDYKIDLLDYELASSNCTIQIKEGNSSKDLIYFRKGDYFEPDEFEFTEIETEINHVKIYDNEDEEIELTDNQHLRLCNYIRVHKITE